MFLKVLRRLDEEIREDEPLTELHTQAHTE